MGTVLVNGLPVTMIKSQVLDLLMTKNTTKLLVNETKFQTLVNGVLQAKGNYQAHDSVGGDRSSLN